VVLDKDIEWEDKADELKRDLLIDLAVQALVVEKVQRAQKLLNEKKESWLLD
jgi:hypothetical protein